jgi:hypothetical protein
MDTYIKVVGLVVGLLVASHLGNHAEETSNGSLREAHEFLQAIYPDLKGKGYFTSFEGSRRFDDPIDVRTVLKLFVGKGPKGFVTGSVNGQPQFAEQLLSTEFTFEGEILVAFSANGVPVGRASELHKLVELRENHPTMTELQAAGALRQSGVKFGSWNKDDFLKALPISRLQPFLGKLSVVSADFTVPGEDHVLPHEWPNWKVRAKTTPVGGPELFYEMTFEPFNGDLTALTTASLSSTH